MRIAAFESPLVATRAQSVRGGLNTALCSGRLDQHVYRDFSAAYRTAAEWSNTLTGYALNTTLQSWGIAQIELDYQEDLVFEYPIDERSAEPTNATRYTLPCLVRSAEFVEPYVTPCPLFASLAALLAYVRRHFTVDTQLYWGETPQGYGGIALYSLSDSSFVPLFDLHLALPYSPLSAQLIEEAGSEWALRHLPESLSDQLKDPRPLVTLGAQPYYQQTVSQHLLKPSRWKPLNRSKQSENSLRSVWETFLIPHQQLGGYVQQWQEILYRFLPVYCQWSERLAQQSKVLQQKQILSPYFERSVTPIGRMAQEVESLRGLAQVRLVSQSQPVLTPKELLRWPEFSRRWQLFLNDYGHCGALDLAQPRVHEQGDVWLKALLTPWCEGHPHEDLSWVQRLQATRLWRDYETLYTLREKLWSDTLWALDQVKRRIHDSTNLEFQLLCYQPLEALLASDISYQETAAESTEIPSASEAPAEAAPVDLETQDEVPEQLQGVGLQNGLAQGLLWFGSVAQPYLPPDYVPAQTILCLPEVEAIHLPLIRQAAGVLLTRGNPFSQGSHLLREWNTPTIVQIPEVRLLSEGTPLRLNSDTGVLDILS